MKTKTALALVATLASFASLASIGCGSSSGSSGGGSDNPESTRASLHRAKGCGDLLGDLKGDASYKVNRAINRQIENILACIRHYGDAQCAGYAGFSVPGGVSGGSGGIAEDAPAMNAGAAPAPAAPSAAGAATSSSSSSGSSGTTGTSGGDAKSTASSYSDTNTQVKGVDEADIVKNDGNNVYLLHGNDFKVINAWPANALKEAGSIQIEGNPTEMFVEAGKVVIYSQVNGAAIFQAAGVTPKTSYQEYGYGYAYDAPQAGNAKAGTVAAPAPGGTYPAPTTYAPLTKITVLTLNGTTPVVARETYYEGNYLDSRRVGPQIRTVLQSYQYGPQLKFSIYELQPPTPVPMQDAPNAGSSTSGSTGTGYVDVSPKTGSETIAQLEQLRALNLRLIDATQLPDWLPYTFVKNGNTISATTVACEDFYVPTVGSTQGGMTEVTSIDLGNPGGQPRATAILGQANTVYANADTLYVAANAWVEPPFVWYDQGVGYAGSGTAVATPPSPPTAGSAGGASGSSGGAVADAGAAKPASLKPLNDVGAAPAVAIVSWASSKTHVHKFDFSADPAFANYVASGTVVGSVKDQFSMDDKDGFLRVATSENRQYVTVEGNYYPYDTMTPEQNNNIVPMHPYLLNHLSVLGQHGPWLDVVGDGGDIAPNEQLDSVRFVESRGYIVTFRQRDPLFVFDLSNPNAPNLLASLTISGFSEYMQPMDPNHLLTIGRAADPVSGRTQGLQLQIFDVTDGAKPAVVQRFTYTGSEYGSSDAEYDHKAFTWFPEKGLLAFPYYAYNAATPTGMRSSLEVFHVDAAGGFTKLGSVDVTSLVQKAPTGYCGGYFQPSVRRGVFLENFVYAVAYAGIVARDSSNLGAAGTQLALPDPQLNPGYGPACYPGPIPTPTGVAVTN